MIFIPNTFQAFIKQATVDVAENNDCLYFTVLIQGQRDIPQFTGQNTQCPQSRVTVRLRPEKTDADTLSNHLVSVLWQTDKLCLIGSV